MYVRADSATMLAKRATVAVRGTSRMTIATESRNANCVVPKASALPSRLGGEGDILRMDVVNVES